jgi:predicted nucleic acid-binding protein
MGNGPEPVAVADAGPLIHLREIDHLPLLNIFPEVHVPDAVWAEVVASGRVDEAALSFAAIRRTTVEQRHIASLSTPGGVARRLHRGELECLVLCSTLRGSVLLPDDLAARQAATAHGVRAVGSLGIIVRAYKKTLLSRSDAEALLHRLQDQSSLFITRTIVDLAVESLRKNVAQDR